MNKYLVYSILIASIVFNVIPWPVRAQTNLQLPPLGPRKPQTPEAPRVPEIPTIDPFSLPSGIDSELDLDREITIKSIDFDGNSVISDEKITNLIEPYLGKQIPSSELKKLESEITQLYRDSGYIASGAFIPQLEAIDTKQAEIYIQIIEGRINTIEINGGKRLRRYVKKRLKPLLNKPIQQSKLFNRLRFLLNEPQIENLNVDIQPQQILGQNSLLINIKPARAIEAFALLNNGRSPTVGTFERGVSVIHQNLVGIGDTLELNVRNTDGSKVFAADYGIPITSEGGAVSLSFLLGESQIIEEPFEPFNLESQVKEFALAFQQPIFQRSSNVSLQQVIIGIGIRRTENEDSFDDVPFPITEGSSPDGETRTTVFNFFQNYEFRTRRDTVVFNSDLSFGVDIGNENDPFFSDGEFVKWRGQGAYARRINDRLLNISRASIQITDRSLVSNEQFILGGNNTVRGFRQNAISRDNGITFSNELRYTIFRDESQRHKIEISPFFDLGHGFNDEEQFLEEDETLASIGLGIRYFFSDRIIANFDFGVPIIGSNDSEDSLQEKGVFLGIQVRF